MRHDLRCSIRLGIRLVLLSVSYLAGIVLLASSCAPTTEGAPNILLLVVDSLRWDHVGFAGYRLDTSPCLDSLAAEGVAFTSCIAQAPLTEGSMPSLLTGRYPSSALHNMPHEIEQHLKERAITTGRIDPIGERIIGIHLGEGISTISGLLREEGYSTGAFVANPMISKAWFGLSEEFDFFEANISCASGRCGERISEAALSWLGCLTEKPWFCYIHYMDVHLPYDSPRDYRARFWRGKQHEPIVTVEWLRELKKRGPSKREIRYISAMYDAEIAYLDDQICNLLSMLRARGVSEDDLLVIVASDHGDEFYEHEDFGHAQSLYQELIRCPLILVWQGMIPRGRSTDAIVQNLDIVPTVFDLLGKRIPDGIEGVSLIDILHGSPTTRAAFSERQGTSISCGSWKLWQTPTGTPVLFNVSVDPKEEQNLAVAYPETLRMLDQLLSEWEKGITPPSFRSESLKEVELDSSLVAILRTLGYLE